MTNIRLSEGCEDEARDRILAVLNAHANANDKSFSSKKLFYEVYEDDEYLGGLSARFALDLKWVFVELLAVAETGRGKGIGTKLMARVEADARLQNMHGIWLDTYSFQAPEFYKRLGFREFGRIDGYPESGCRHFFMKRL